MLGILLLLRRLDQLLLLLLQQLLLCLLLLQMGRALNMSRVTMCSCCIACLMPAILTPVPGTLPLGAEPMGAGLQSAVLGTIPTRPADAKRLAGPGPDGGTGLVRTAPVAVIPAAALLAAEVVAATTALAASLLAGFTSAPFHFSQSRWQQLLMHTNSKQHPETQKSHSPAGLLTSFHS